MANKITNGTFDSDLSGWVNGPGASREPFVWVPEMARAHSDKSLDTWRFWMEQDFNLYDVPISALLTAWAKWQPVNDGWVKHWVILKKPSGATVTYYSTTHTETFGEGTILNAQNILSDITEYGTYTLQLIVDIKSSSDLRVCYGWFDNISVDIAVRKTKTIIEKLSAAGTLPKSIEMKVPDTGLKLVEFLDKGLFTSQVLTLEVATALESLSKLVKLSFLEQMTMTESLFKGAGYLLSESEVCELLETLSWARAIGALDEMVLSESLSALLTQGNVQRNINITDLTAWDEVSGVLTRWDKTKVEVL